MKANEYNKKWAIFEYLKQLNKNDSDKMAVSLKVAQTIFLNSGVWKAWQIWY